MEKELEVDDDGEPICNIDQNVQAALEADLPGADGDEEDEEQ